MFFNARILDGDITDDQLKPIDKVAVREVFKEFLPVFRFCDNIRTGLIRLTMQEYQALPMYVMEVWEHYSKVYERVSRKK